MNIIIITGASSGIGQEFARQMDSYFTNIDEFWLIARRKDKLIELADSLKHKARVLAMDVTSQGQLDRLEDTLQDKNAVVRMLVNCAGFGYMGAFEDLETEQALGMIRVNCEALTSITHRVIPYMRQNSRIIQLASSAAFVPQPYFAVYAATKSYVLSFSRALGEELSAKGIYVTSVCPGPVDTPFFDIAEETGTKMAIKEWTQVSASAVVSKALRDSYHKHSLSVCSLPIQGFYLMTKVLPHEWIIKGITIAKNYR